MREMLPEIEYEGNYEVPLSPFVTSIFFWFILVGHGNFSNFKLGPVT